MVACIYIAWVLYMFWEPSPADSFRGMLLIALTSPASFIVLGLATKFHFDVPGYFLPFANVLLLFSPFLLVGAIRAAAKRRR